MSLDLPTTVARIARDAKRLAALQKKTLAAAEKQRAADREVVAAQYEARLSDLKARYEDALQTERRAFEDHIRQLKSRAADALVKVEALESQTADALALKADLDSGRVGLLYTDNLPKLTAFEALSENWERLTNYQIDQIIEICTK
jgi:hypothetical protein